MDQVGALQFLNMHVKLRYAQRVQGAQQHGFGGPSKKERVPRPTLHRNMSEDEYINFHRLGRDTHDVDIYGKEAMGLLQDL